MKNNHHSIDVRKSVRFNGISKTPHDWAILLGYDWDAFLKDCETVITPTDEVIRKLLEYRFNGEQCTLYFKDSGHPKDLTGMRFGRLKALNPLSRSMGIWRCQCDCGEFIEASRRRLVGRCTTSCGCLMKECQTAFGLAREKGLPIECRNVTFKGRTMSIREWSRQPEQIEKGIKRRNIYSRLKSGWSVERALTEPCHTKCIPVKYLK